jgi:hypothetical protein
VSTLTEYADGKILCHTVLTEDSQCARKEVFRRCIRDWTKVARYAASQLDVYVFSLRNRTLLTPLSLHTIKANETNIYFV